jgi:hypothetical protein
MKTSHLHSPSAKAKLKAYIAAGKPNEKQATTLLHDLIQAPLTFSSSPWRISSTTPFALKVSDTGAAILPKALRKDSDLPRILQWRKIIREIGRKGEVADFVYDVELQHHHSTNGRWNEALERWERYGVRPVDGWRRTSAERTFHRYKAYLVERGLIVASSHLWRGRTYLWVKPTDELSRILFEPGHWEQVREQYLPPQNKKKNPKPKSDRKPRGISARHRAVDDELRALYKNVLSGEMTGLSKAERIHIYKQLTQPIAFSPSYSKAPFAPEMSFRWKRIRAALGLWDAF